MAGEPYTMASDADKFMAERLEDERNNSARIATDRDYVSTLTLHDVQGLENAQEILLAEHDTLATDLQNTKQQVQIQRNQIEALNTQVQILEKQLTHDEPDLRAQVYDLSAKLVDARILRETQACLQHTHPSTYPDERTILLQQLQRAGREVEKWKAEAMGRGRDAVSRVWQSRVDETVRREREKDAAVIVGLRAEIRQLQVKKDY